MPLLPGSNNNPNNIYLGSNPVNRIYLGGAQVWPDALSATNSVLPLIATTQFDGDTATVDTSRLSNITNIQWQVVAGTSLGTDVTQDLTGLGGQYVEVATTSDEGVLTSPPIHVYSPMMMASHNTADAALLAVAPHTAATKVAIINGDWSSSATWAGGVPTQNDIVLIPHGVSVRYDLDAPATLIRQLRVDGVFSFATDGDTHLYVRDIVGSRGSVINIGNSLGDRIASNVQATITFEGQTPLDLATDPELLSRGLVTNGALNVFGAEKLNHSRAATGEVSGSTSIVLEQVPTGWVAGDQIVIGATALDRPTGIGIGIDDISEDEIVTITGVVGNTVSFTPALVHDHNDQNPDTNRGDVRPMVQLRAQSRNVIVQSEVTTPVTQRGHVMCMHHHSRTDLWDVGLVGLGRTDKSRRVGGKDTNGDFAYHDGTGIITEPFTADANIRGRYSFHTHIVGYDHAGAGRPQPLAVNVTIEDNPGWAFTHHDCEMDIRSCSAFRVYGCGFVAEQGGELGLWSDLSVMQATAKNIGTVDFLSQFAKGQMNFWGVGGDYFNDGYGFGYRGRSLIMVDCVATTCTNGHVFWHRGYAPGQGNLFEVTNPPRARMDLKETGMANSTFANIEDEVWTLAAYPIVHFAGCGAVACLTGVYVSKQAPQQNHDFNVIWKGFYAHGCRNKGVEIEYVGTYILEDLDIVMGPDKVGNSVGSFGVVIGANTAQIAIVRPRIEGTRYSGIAVNAANAPPTPVEIREDSDAVTNPRFWVIGYEGRHNRGVEIDYVNAGVKTFEQIAVVDVDQDQSYIDYDLDPTHTFPDVIGEISGGPFGIMNQRPDNTAGLKFGNHPVGLPISDKLWLDTPFPRYDSQVSEFIQLNGYSQFNGNDVMIQRDILSDVLTGRPAKFTWFWEADGPLAFGTDNGAVIMSPEVTTTDELITVAPGGSVTFNALAGAAGGSGSFEIDDGDFVSPDYGKLDINHATGMVTYTPHAGVVDQSDFGYIFIRSMRDTGVTKTETRAMGTKRISFLITNNSTMSAPVHNTNYSYSSTANAGEFEVSLLQYPQTGSRRVKVVEYSTDSGVTWRRLCNGYPLTTISVDVASDGIALTAGAVDVRLRYLTDHENGYSPETGDVSVIA